MNSQINKTKRLSNEVNNKPKPNEKTYQASLTKEDIAKSLEDYVRVESNKMHLVPLNTHLRYFVINPKTGEKQFRLGGFLTKIDESNQYVVLSNGQYSWSVQLATSLFYKKLSPNEYKEHLQTEIDKNYESQMSKLIEENKKLKKMIEQIKETTIKEKEKEKKKDKDREKDKNRDKK